jgi:hypothetical protein
MLDEIDKLVSELEAQKIELHLESEAASVGPF